MSSRLPCRSWLGAVAFTAHLAPAAAAGDAGSAGAAAPPPPAQSAPAERVAERARQLFDEGVKLANEQRFDSARAVFRSAYELQPHPSVLYNIAQCEVRLGELASAEATLQQFLDSSGNAIPEPQRQAVQRQLAELRAALPAASPDQAGSPTLADKPAVAATPGVPPNDGSAASASVGIVAAPLAPSPLAAPPLASPPVAVPPDVARSGSESSLRPLLLGGTGLLLLGTSAALYVWNDGRYDAWSDEQAELASIPGFRVQVARDPELWSRAQASNQRLSSIHTVDVVSVVLATAGALAVGGGAWDWLSGKGESTAGKAMASGLPRVGSQLRLQAGATPLLRWRTDW